MTQTFAPVNLGGGPLAVSPDGTRLATVDVRRQYGFRDVLLWNMSGHLLRHLNVRQAGFLEFSPDGRWLATSDASEQFSRDAKTLLIGGNAWPDVCDAATVERMFPLPQNNSEWLPNERLVLWDMQTHKPRWTVPLPTVEGSEWDETYVLALSPDGRMAAVGSAGGGLLLYDAADGHLIHSLTSRGPYPSGIGILRGLLFSGNGRLLIGAGGNGVIREWNVTTGAPVASLATPGVQGLTPLPGGQAFLAMVGRDIDVVRVAGLRVVKRLRGHDENVNSLALAPDGKTLWSAAADGTIKRWNLQTGACAATYGRIQQAALSPDGKTLAYSLGDSTVTLRDLATGKTMAMLSGFARPQVSARQLMGFDSLDGSKTLAFSPNGRMLAGGAYTTAGLMDECDVFGSRAVVWDVRSGRLLHDWEEDPAGQIAFSPDGRRIGLMAPIWPVMPGRIPPGLIQVRALPTGKVVREWYPPGGRWDEHPPQVNLYGAMLGFNTRGQALLAATRQVSASIAEPGVWDVATGRLLRAFPGWGKPESVALSSDGSMLVGINYAKIYEDGFRAVHVWNVTTGSLCAAATWQDLPAPELFSGGDKWFAVAAQAYPDNANQPLPVRLISTMPGRPPVTLAGGTGGIVSFSFRADGREFVCVSADGTARVWKDEPAK